MRPRHAAAAVAAAALVAAGGPVAFAAPRRACHQLVDALGDATSARVVPSRDALDIRSGDVATGRHNLVAVLRLSSFDPDVTLAPGVTYTLSWQVAGVGQSLSYRHYSNGTGEAAFDPDVASGQAGPLVAAARVDRATATVTWTVPRRANPALARRGATFSALSAWATPSVNVAPPSPVPGAFRASATFAGGDTATSRTTYRDLTPSCVPGT